jgi:hypothetical protein
MLRDFKISLELNFIQNQRLEIISQKGRDVGVKL